MFFKKNSEGTDWKLRNKIKQKEIKKLKKRIHELEESRERYKKENKRLRDDMGELKKTSLQKSKDQSRPKRYWFTTIIICMTTRMKLETPVSFRALSKIIWILIFYFKISTYKPTHTTILNWIHKIGYCRLNSKKEIADDWILIADESIQIGQDKVLMIYGIREKNIPMKRALEFKDLQPLRIIVKTNWNGDRIKDILLELKKELGGIKYVVSDNGSDLKKGIREAGLVQIHDLTHHIALILERLLAEDETFKTLCKMSSEIRLKYVQTALAYMIPPVTRNKSRYLNIGPLTKWWLQMIQMIKIGKRKDEIELVRCLLPYRSFIEELSGIMSSIHEIECVLKNEGLTEKTEVTCSKILASMKGERAEYVRTCLNDYFKEMQSRLAGTKRILITSDIIESAFGKYKNYISNNQMAGITNLVLSLAAFTADLSSRNVKKWMEATTIGKIREWTEKNIGTTLYKRRFSLMAEIKNWG